MGANTPNRTTTAPSTILRTSTLRNYARSGQGTQVTTLTLIVYRRDHLGDLDHERANTYTRHTTTVETMALHGKVRAEFDKPTTRNKAGDTGGRGFDDVPIVRDGGAGDPDDVLSVRQGRSPRAGAGRRAGARVNTGGN